MTSDDSRSDIDNRIDARRRRLLAALGAGGAAGLAGCGGGDGDGTATPTEEDFGTPPGEGTPSDTDTPGDGTPSGTETPSQDIPDFVDGATHRMWMAMPDTPLPNWQYDKMQIRDTDGPGIPREVYPLVLDNRGEVDLVTGDVVGVAFSDWEYSDTEITFTFRDDARWSTGDDIIGADLGMAYKLDEIRSLTPQGVMDEYGELRSVGDAISDVTWDGKSFTLHSEDGGFGNFYLPDWITAEITSAGSKELNEDRFIYEPILQEVQDLGDTRPGQANHEQANTLVETYFDDRTENVDYTEQRYSGPWVIDDVSQQNVTLVPNEEHRNTPNWSEVQIRPIENQQQRFTAIQSNTVDSVSGLGDPPSAQVIRALPDNWQRHLWSAGDRADGIGTQGQLDLLGDRVFKWGLMHSIDNARLARIVHEFASGAMQAPPGAHWTGARQWIPDDVFEGYRMYEFDTDQAEQYFQEVGMTKEGGSWLRPDGSDLTIKFLTDAQSFSYEQTVASMLSDVGINVQITRVDSATFTNRQESGDYQMERDGWWGPAGFYYRALQQEVRRKRFGLWPESQVQNWIEEHDNIENIDYDWTHNIEGFTLDQTREFTRSAPPIGEPDAEPTEEYPVVYYDLLLGRNISEEERREAHQALSWAWNYNAPIMQLHATFNIAFLDHEQYHGPSDDREWAFYEPTAHLMQTGEISALDAAAEDQ